MAEAAEEEEARLTTAQRADMAGEEENDDTRPTRRSSLVQTRAAVVVFLSTAVIAAILVIAFSSGSRIRGGLPLGRDAEDMLAISADDASQHERNHEETQASHERVSLDAAVAAAWLRRRDDASALFRRRFPRHSHHYGASPSASRLITRRRLPARLLRARSPPSSAELKVDEVLYALDADADGAADPFELRDWMIRLQKVVYE